MSDQGAPLMCNAPRNDHSASKTRVNALMGGLGANKPPRWSAERRASPGAQTVKASLRGDARGLREWPAHDNGCRCTRAPVGAPLPSFGRGKDANLGGDKPREKDDACAVFVARVEPQARLRASSTRYGETRERCYDLANQSRISPRSIRATSYEHRPTAERMKMNFRCSSSSGSKS
jgi:hypothetical protein